MIDLKIIMGSQTESMRRRSKRVEREREEREAHAPTQKENEKAGKRKHTIHHCVSL